MKVTSIPNLVAALLMLTLLQTTSICQAEVNSMTGTYYVSVGDLDGLHTGFYYFMRSYRSDNKESGMFGTGWSIPFEKRLRSENNALVLYDRCLQEYVRYVPAQGTVLTKDSTFSSIPLGATFTNVRAKCRKIVRTEDGFIHTCNGKCFERFNDQGEISRLMDGNEIISVLRADSGRIDALVDSSGHRVQFSYNEEGMVKEILYEGRSLKTFTYISGCLRTATTVYGVEERYLYGQDGELVALNSGFHNEYVYYDLQGDHRVLCVKNSTGSETSYRYEIDPADPGHATTDSVYIDEQGKEGSHNNDQFFQKMDASGYRWLSRRVENHYGVQTVTEYTRSGFPLLIESGNDKAIFHYDSEGRLTYMIDREGVVTEIEYDSRHGKISRFTKSFPKPKDKRHVLSFQYDSQGHLITAEGSDGRRAVVSYFPNGMINELKAGKWIVHYTYNDQNKPIRIAVKGLGACRFLYSRTSENYTVKPKSGSTKILEAVNSAFEVLSGIVDETFINYSLY